MEFVLVNKFFRVGKTEVSIQCDKPFTFFTRELEGDHLGDTDETLIEAVKEILRTELDPTSAIVQAQAKLQETQAKLEQAEYKLAETEAKQTATDQAVKYNQAETDRYGKIIHAVVLNAVAGKTIAYGTNYKELVELIPLAEVGKRYMAHDLITLEDPTHVEVDGEGKRILVQLNKEFTYNGEPVSDFDRNGRLEMDGTGAAWKYEPQETTVAPAAAVSTTTTVTPAVPEPSATAATPNQ
ncbi:hypothetical protein [Streptococcus sp. 116-D4]|uniref:hypothetical protein n=1 Tax=Streptococcus sp. 116-D4 TaxID=2598453 RepID=UPI0012B44376|nr:hypothetical protein [Streptococcus sp. 116-D4]BBP09814.1 hypothetical protein UKS_10160 [Streptococcus sp. 116-D4]